jgi:DNA gyrase subunit A
VVAGDQVMLITQEGMLIRTPVDNIREIGRSTQGVKLMNLEGEDRIVAAAKVAERDAPGPEGEGEEALAGAVEAEPDGETVH